MHVCSTSSVILNNEAQLIFRDLHSETVKNDDNSSRYEISSHEPSAYDGAHKEEKEEGERKGKKEDVAAVFTIDKLLATGNFLKGR